MSFGVGILLIITFFVVQTVFIIIKLLLISAAIKKVVNNLVREVENTLSGLRSDAGQKGAEDAPAVEQVFTGSKEGEQKRAQRHA